MCRRARQISRRRRAELAMFRACFTLIRAITEYTFHVSVVTSFQRLKVITACRMSRRASLTRSGNRSSARVRSVTVVQSSRWLPRVAKWAIALRAQSRAASTRPAPLQAIASPLHTVIERKSTKTAAPNTCAPNQPPLHRGLDEHRSLRTYSQHAKAQSVRSPSRPESPRRAC